MSAIKTIEAGGSHADGILLGQTGEKLAFLGAAPIVQRAGAAQAAVATTAATSTTPFGYAEAQANAIVTLLNEIRAALVAVGIIKGAA